MGKMKGVNVYVISDIHLEFYDGIGGDEVMKKIADQVNRFECNVVVIAGDLCPIRWARQVLNKFAEMVPDSDILYVPGNHEFYGENYARINRDKLNIIVREDLNDRVFMLDRSTYSKNDVVFHGITGWIDESWQRIHFDEDMVEYNFYRRQYSDFSLIKNFQLTLEKGKSDFKWLCNQLNNYKEFNARIQEYNVYQNQIVITHFMPCKEFVHPRFLKSKINNCFANDWKEKIKNLGVDYWIYGHTHDKSIKTENGTKFICNPVGYPHEPTYSLTAYVINL